jgi:hypothetical protein
MMVAKQLTKKPGKQLKELSNKQNADPPKSPL